MNQIFIDVENIQVALRRYILKQSGWNFIPKSFSWSFEKQEIDGVEVPVLKGVSIDGDFIQHGT